MGSRRSPSLPATHPHLVRPPWPIKHFNSESQPGLPFVFAPALENPITIQHKYIVYGNAQPDRPDLIPVKKHVAVQPTRLPPISTTLPPLCVRIKRLPLFCPTPPQTRTHTSAALSSLFHFLPPPPPPGAAAGNRTGGCAAGTANKHNSFSPAYVRAHISRLPPSAPSTRPLPPPSHGNRQAPPRHFFLGVQTHRLAHRVVASFPFPPFALLDAPRVCMYVCKHFWMDACVVGLGEGRRTGWTD